jgi:hypothetical protein
MSFLHKPSNTYTLTETNIDRKKQAHEAKRKAFKENKGNWEFRFFQKKFDQNLEAKIKLSLNPKNGFNPNNIHIYLNPEISKEELIVAKKNKGERLKNAELIIYKNYIDRKANAIKSDIQSIKKFGLNAKPQTNEGRTRLLLYTLDLQLKKKNIDNIANIYLRLMEDQFKITPEIAIEYADILESMNKTVEQLDMTELQFNKFHSQMPPLNIKGFQKFDDWQINVINNIDNNISTIVNAPTSAGKSVLSGYAITKGKTLFVVPTDALAWQMSAYIGGILDTNIPILTSTYQTNPTRDEMTEILNRAPSIVGTADSIVDYLPFIKNGFKWIIFDEIHMIGKSEGSAMEHIAKIFHMVPFLALSATIGNTDELVEWFKRLSPGKQVTKIVCDKRFFNLQRYCYQPETDSITRLHPLALVDIEQFADKTVLKKTLQPTPPDVWNLALKIKEKFNNEQLDPDNYFPTNHRIQLDESMEYFNKMILFLVEQYPSNIETVSLVVNSYKYSTLASTSVDLIKLAFRLKQEDKTPVIIFQKNTIACLRMAREFAKNVEELEFNKYPKLISERIKIAKLAKRLDKRYSKIIDTSDSDPDKSYDNSGTRDKKNKKETKQLMGGVKLKKDGYGEPTLPPLTKPDIQVTSIQEPHEDFIFGANQYFSESMVEEWVDELKKYFPNSGEYYHFMIKLLWRGVGVYAKGLPDPYLRLVQSLACQKQIGIVFSDQSLVFGVSMPFRTVVVIRDEKTEDDLDAMLFQQMSGRAGRRGLDKEGNVVFAGYSWSRIKELSVSEPPIVSGMSNTIYTIPHANQLSKLFETNQNWNVVCKNFLDTNINEEDAREFLEGIVSNYNEGWSFGIVNDNVNHLFMNWKLRYNDDCLIASMLLPYLRRAFEDKNHTQECNQIKLAHFLCRFLSTKSTKSSTNALENPDILSTSPYNQIIKQLDALQIDMPEFIDNRVFLSIQQNSVVKSQSEDATDELRHRLLEFGEKIINIQHYCFHSKITGLSRLFGKLLTRIWWIYHSSSPLMKPIKTFETEEFADVDTLQHSDESDESEPDTDYESESDLTESDDEN